MFYSGKELFTRISRNFWPFEKLQISRNFWKYDIIIKLLNVKLKYPTTAEIKVQYNTILEILFGSILYLR